MKISTRKLGYLSAIAGVIFFLVSLVADYLGVGDRRLGAGQLLGMEVGIILFLTGIWLATFDKNDSHFDLSEGLQRGTNRLVNLPVGVWVLIGFLVVYIFFFLIPVFLNPERAMFYFNRFLPDKKPIGLDIRVVMDYINAWLTSNQSPYADGFIAYPPLALILFSPLLLIGYPSYYFLITFASLLLFTVSTLLIPVLSNRGDNHTLPVLMFGLGLFSYGFQFELERGQSNIIAFSLCLLAVYLFHANDKLHYPAYLLFTLGVQIKIHPAILIVMFIKNWRDWKSNVKRMAGIFALNIGLLFISGIRIFNDFVRAVRGQQVYGGTWNGNHSVRGFVFHLGMDGFGWFSPETLSAFQKYQSALEFSMLAILGLCLLAVFLRAYIQVSTGLNPNLLVACTICALVVPSISNDYKLPILIAPMALFWSNLSLPVDSLGKRVLSILLIVISSLAYWSIQYPFVVKPYFLTRNFPALFVLMLVVTVLTLLTRPKPAIEAFTDAQK